MKIPVLNRTGEIIYRVHSAEVARMLARRQAVYSVDRRCLQLLPIVSDDNQHAGRTHTSRGGFLAAIGRSQQYTTSNGRGQVDGFKVIYIEDRDVFRSAVIDCLRAHASANGVN